MNLKIIMLERKKTHQKESARYAGIFMKNNSNRKQICDSLKRKEYKKTQGDFRGGGSVPRLHAVIALQTHTYVRTHHTLHCQYVRINVRQLSSIKLLTGKTSYWSIFTKSLKCTRVFSLN